MLSPLEQPASQQKPSKQINGGPFNFIGIVFTAILYGKYSSLTIMGSDDKRSPCNNRSVLPDIWLILANPTQESTGRAIERRIPLCAHYQFHSEHGVFYHHHHRGPVSYHRGSSST